MWTNQAKAINAGIGEAVQKLDEVDAKLDLSNRVIKAIRKMQWVIVAVVIIVSLTLYFNYQVVHRLNSCIDPKGQCARKGQETSDVTIHLLVLKIEENRLVSSIETLKAENRTAAVEATTARLIDIRKQLAVQFKKLNQLREQEQK